MGGETETETDRDTKRKKATETERPSWKDRERNKGSVCALDLSFAHVSMIPCVFLCLFVV